LGKEFSTEATLSGVLRTGLSTRDSDTVSVECRGSADSFALGDICDVCELLPSLSVAVESV
jgi:hypothetical protein